MYSFRLAETLILIGLAGTITLGTATADPPGCDTPHREVVERVMDGLSAKCRKMLDLQTAVYEDIVTLRKAIDGTIDKKPRKIDQESALTLADKQKEIVTLAAKTVEMLEADGVAVAFPEVFRQLRDDMKEIQRRLEICEVGDATHAIAKDTIETLNEMIWGLKK